VRTRVSAVLIVACVALAAAPAATAEQSGSKRHRVAAGFLDADAYTTCVILTKGRLRCWGDGTSGQLGYGNQDTIGDNELPSSVGPISLGAGRKARAVAASEIHTCAILDNGRVRCWGAGLEGILGYGNPDTIGDDELPSSAGPVRLGGKAVAITASGTHTCAILAGGKVRCWGTGVGGRLGYGSTDTIGDNETPASVGPVFLGPGRKARTITAGGGHTCALLDNGRVRCWGVASNGQLGYGNLNNVGDNETPGSVVPVSLGRKAVAVSAGEYHTCAILDNGKVRCWGRGSFGELGTGSTGTIGDDELPTAVPAISFGRRKAVQVSAGYEISCVVLDNGKVRCWGDATDGKLGLGNPDVIGDNELPTAVAPIKLGRTAVAVSAGWGHACALLDNGRLRCWGFGAVGSLGYGNSDKIGDDETPDTAGPVQAGGLVPTRVKPGISLALRPARDARWPYSFHVAGKLTGFLGDTASCTGKALVITEQFGLAASRHAKLKPAAGGCSFAAAFTVPFGRWFVTARFIGNGSLRPRRSGVRTFHVG
jgi:alpha-tubulin suppressor-like RCC1 family protein